MRAPRTVFWSNDARSGAENLVEADDPRQTCVAINAGEFKADAEAERLGLLQYFYGGGGGQPQAREGRQAQEQDPAQVSRQAVEASKSIREDEREYHTIMRPAREEVSVVENAVGTGNRVTEAERQLAGEMGAEITGPTLGEVREAGGPQEAQSRVTETMSGGEQRPQPTPPSEQAQARSEPTPPEEPKPSEGSEPPPPPRQSRSR